MFSVQAAGAQLPPDAAESLGGIVFLQLGGQGAAKVPPGHAGIQENPGPIRVNRSLAFDLSKVRDFTQGTLVISMGMN